MTLNQALSAPRSIVQDLVHSTTEPKDESQGDGFIDSEIEYQEETPVSNKGGLHEYRGEPISWVKPALNTGAGFSDEALQRVFSEQRSPVVDIPYDAYAFDEGPRKVPPFRPLRLIREPKFHDTCGWAENLRWVAEQHSTFGETGWTESPQHMERIAQIRQEQIWASSELVLKTSDEMEEEERDEAWLSAMGAPELSANTAERELLIYHGELTFQSRNVTEMARMSYPSQKGYRNSWRQAYC
ncbi:hypothetical protein N0V90_012523 [Kalmusia sp. IMI 367209]|nr:hypothetical protein N0V90_012523 [Kalmusia sp. IMI 367209]